MLRCLMLIVLSLVYTVQVQSSLAAEPRTDRCVILISVDGLANFYLDDPKADMPTIRALAQNGAAARDGMLASFPTVTWPNHTTLVTGVPPAEHGVLGNNYFDRETKKPVQLIVDPVFDKSEVVRVPTIYDVAHEAGLKTCGILWPSTRNAKGLDLTVPDMGGDAWSKYGTPGWMTELREAGLPVDHHGIWCKQSGGGVPRDWLYTRMLTHVLDHHAPNLILIHLVEADHVQHRTGPRTPDAYWVTSYEDDRVRDIVEAAHRSKFGKNSTIIVTSDHGFFPIEKDIRPNILFKKQQPENGPAIARAVGQGGACMIYILDQAHKEKLLPKIKAQLAGLEGVAKVFEPEEFAKLGQATPTEDPRAPDLWVAAKSGYSFTNSTSGDDIVFPRSQPGGTHGYLPTEEDLHAMLVISGAGIQSGVDLGQVSNLDVAPTIAELLGVSLPTAKGKVLKAALKK